MMSTELAGISDFSMPEYYFRIRREEQSEAEGGNRAIRNAGPKFFSKIDRVLWEDL
jgi:hypothetical protein